MRMALVIFWVLRTDAMRLFISLRLAKMIYDLQFDRGCGLLDDGGDAIVNLSFLERSEHIVLVRGAEQIKERGFELTRIKLEI